VSGAGPSDSEPAEGLTAAHAAGFSAEGLGRVGWAQPVKQPLLQGLAFTPKHSEKGAAGIGTRRVFFGVISVRRDQVLGLDRNPQKTDVSRAID
jgi:hypothetical protein